MEPELVTAPTMDLIDQLVAPNNSINFQLPQIRTSGTQNMTRGELEESVAPKEISVVKNVIPCSSSVMDQGQVSVQGKKMSKQDFR